MSDLNNIGLIRDDDPDTFRITFDDQQSPLYGSDTGSHGAVFNLSDKSQRATGSSVNVGSDSFYLPNGTVLPLDTFATEVVAQLDGFDDSSIKFKGTANNDLFNLEGLDGVTEDGSIDSLYYVMGSGRDTVIFPDGGQEWNFDIGSGVLDAGDVFSDAFWAYDAIPKPAPGNWEDYDFTGLTYRYTNATDLTVKSASGSSVYVDVTAKNVYKIFDSAYSDDTFFGSTGTQQFKSYGGFDSVFGRAGDDYFRASGSFLQEDWGGADLYNEVGHNLFINDYEYGERISIEDFGLTEPIKSGLKSIPQVTLI